MTKHRLIAAAAALLALAPAARGALTFGGVQKTVITDTPTASTGLDDVYVLYSTQGVTATYTASSATAPVVWYRFSALGGGFAEEVAGVTHSGDRWTLPAVEPDMGYIIEDTATGARYYCWVVDYSAHRMTLDALTIAPDEGDCDVVTLLPQGHADPIYYYTINGRRVELSRQLEVDYTTQAYDEAAHAYTSAPASVEVESFGSSGIHVAAPYCDTRFTLSGDRFLQRWGEGLTAVTDTYATRRVACTTTATQAEGDYDHSNEQTVGGDDTSLMGGSAPCEITFDAAVTDAAIFTEWQMSRDEEFTDITMRESSTTLAYTFTDQGTTYVRFVCADSGGGCGATGEVYTVFIGDSALQCPNAFSPGASEGVNDEWRVSYKSIVEFECHIFDKWGRKMATLTHPSQGWDGRSGGKLVPAGAYYYVIKARGADGKDYNLSGDINIINYK